MRVVICVLTVYFIYLSVAGADLQIMGGGGHPDLELRGGLVSKIFFSALQASVLGLKLWWVGALWGPSPGSATAYKPVFRTLNCCELRGIQ